jgi:spermidine synthase
VIGGGDGGVLREIVKHECVESVVLVEIDEAVPRVSKKYLPAMAVGFQHPKVSVHIGDGFEYLKNNTGSYDVIITDSSDPVGPASSLFEPTFYDLMHKALLPGGIICTQGKLDPGDDYRNMHAPRRASSVADRNSILVE